MFPERSLTNAAYAMGTAWRGHVLVIASSCATVSMFLVRCVGPFLARKRAPMAHNLAKRVLLARGFRHKWVLSALRSGAGLVAVLLGLLVPETSIWNLETMSER